MDFHYESLKTLSEQAVVYLKNKGKSESTVTKYVWIWKQIDRYLHEHQIMECNKSAIIGFVQQKFGNRPIRDLTHYQKSCVSQAFNLIQFKETGEMFEMIELVPKEKAVLKSIAFGDFILVFTTSIRPFGSQTCCIVYHQKFFTLCLRHEENKYRFVTGCAA